MTTAQISALRERYRDGQVREVLGGAETGTVVDVDDRGLFSVTWPNGRKTVHVEDELSLVADRAGRPPRSSFLPTMQGDPFSRIRGVLKARGESFGDEESEGDDAQAPRRRS